ncbi:MAG: nicotinamidase [Actinobacteria bacterium]|nr:MAG: nicotinamidase [Actinomycetota bacterium]
MADALLIVDVQNDFTPPDGALAVPRGDEVIEPINALATSGSYELVVATRDWHPPDHSSFRSQGGPWPEHCVRDTHGAQLDSRLQRDAIDLVIDKGTSRDAPGYSAFESTRLLELLRDRGVDHVIVAGLATDFCVRHTALDALKEGLQISIQTAAVRGIDAEDSDRSLEELKGAGAEVI